MISDVTLRMSPRAASDPESVRRESARLLGIPPSAVNDLRVVRKSIDARKRNVQVNLAVKVATGDTGKVWTYQPKEYRELPDDAPRVVIVGAGPAGLFAALRAIELGMRPIVLERGKDVDSRRLDLAAISRTGTVDPDSNYCFGEGGAGAYSDGKLYTRSKKRGNVDEVLQILHQHGASESILVDSHPHIGSDKLPGVIRNIRETIKAAGGEVRFQTTVTGLIIEDDEVKGVRLKDGGELDGPVILATGHSARDVYRFLKAQGVAVEPKGLAIGVRLEHPQELIDILQYHSPEGRGRWLPAAEYNFVTQADGRGVYSFCMCPGGVIVPSMTGPEQSVVNGMSASARASQWANSAMVVELHPGDIKGFEQYGELEMLELQESLERKFYEETKSTRAPAQRMDDFMNGRLSSSFPRTSYAPGLKSARLDQLLPSEISGRLKSGFADFNRKCPGFMTNEAVMVGLESRTSSPVRIPRDRETYSHVDMKGLYPAGEGAGYAGGIVSAAIDGQRCAEACSVNIIKNENL